MGRVKIVTDAGTRNRKVRVHYDGGINSTTVCGIALEGGVDLDEVGEAQATDQQVNCDSCLGIVKYCQSLPKVK